MRHLAGYRLTLLPKSGEIPNVGEVPTLLRLHRLNRAFRTIKEDAFMVPFLNERQALPVLADPGIGFDKLVFRHAFKMGELTDLFVGDFDLSGPPTTGRAALAFIERRHFDRGLAPPRRV